jgi:hypothetical protein
MLDAAKALDDLKAPPANTLEALETDRLGQHSIRVKRPIPAVLYMDWVWSVGRRVCRLPLGPCFCALPKPDPYNPILVGLRGVGKAVLLVKTVSMASRA